MDTLEESSLAPRPGRAPAPKPTCSHIPQEQLHVPGFSFSAFSDAQPSQKHLTESFVRVRNLSVAAAAPPKLAAAGVWHLSLCAERGPQRKLLDPPQGNGCFFCFSLFNIYFSLFNDVSFIFLYSIFIFLYLMVSFCSYHSEKE